MIGFFNLCHLGMVGNCWQNCKSWNSGGWPGSSFTKQCKERVCTPNNSLLTHWKIQWAQTWSFAKFSETRDLHQFHTYSYNSEHFWRGMWRRSLRTLQKWTRCWRSNILFIWEHSLFHWARLGLWAGIMIQDPLCILHSNPSLTKYIT